MKITHKCYQKVSASKLVKSRPSAKSENSHYLEVYSEILNKLACVGFDANSEEVAAYARAAAELGVYDPDFDVNDWYKQTELNYPEDLDVLPVASIDSCDDIPVKGSNNIFYFGEEQANKYGSKICENLAGREISKRRDKAEEPGGLKYEADLLGIDMWDLLEALEGLCYQGKCQEIDDSTYKVTGSTDLDDIDDYASVTASGDLYGLSDVKKYLSGKVDFYGDEIELDYGDGFKLAKYLRKQGKPVWFSPSMECWYIPGECHWYNCYFYPYPPEVDEDGEEWDGKPIDADTIIGGVDISQIDDDELFDIAENYNTSNPVSGDWDTETLHEQQAIADHFDISLEEAKQLMIDRLGFSDEDFKAVTSSTELDDADSDYTMLRTKQVPDSDGFMTDYTLYEDSLTGEYVCVFGDKDTHLPEDGYFDFETESEDEANEWFDSYEGLID